MTFETNKGKSALAEGLQHGGFWDDLIKSPDEELYDPFFQSATALDGHDPSYTPSAFDGPPSDYAASAPPSIVGDLSPLGQDNSWLSGMPSHTTAGTSPFIELGSQQPLSTSFDFCEDVLSPSLTSPLLDSTAFVFPDSHHTASVPAIFNPHIASSPHAFSGLDVTASQAFSNLGTWAEHLPTQNLHEDHLNIPEIGIIPDEDITPMSIPVPHGVSRSFGDMFAPPPWVSGSFQQQEWPPLPTPPQPITISHSRGHTQHAPSPQPIAISHSLHHTQHAPPLSVSPERRRLPRSAPMSGITSKNDGRRAKTKPSPTSKELGWVSYHPQANRLVPSADDNQGRRNRGRYRELTNEQRSHAALMRRVHACENCRRRKEKCDPGVPCRSCLDHYKGDLVNHPCRSVRISDLSSDFLSARLGWHPTERTIASFVGSHECLVHSEITYLIPLLFGFGPPLHLPTYAVQIKNMPSICHKHIIYSWPPSPDPPQKHMNAVLPAILTPEGKKNLQTALDEHLSLLVQQHFRSFPLYCSQLHILREVYVLYRSLSTNTPSSHLLEQAFKLLVLVHIGGDITLPTPSSHPVLQQLVNSTMSPSESANPTPCFIRSQFGAVMPTLALCLTKEILLSLEQLLLNHEAHQWPVALATLIVVLITIESIQYHSAKLPYHHTYDSIASRSRLETESQADDEAGVKTLLAFYTACFSTCHARLHDKCDVGSMGLNNNSAKPEEKFVANIREAIQRASVGGYLAHKAGAQRVGDDMAYFFDRLAARLLVLNTT